jgi:hypothetical protein
VRISRSRSLQITRPKKAYTRSESGQVKATEPQDYRANTKRQSPRTRQAAVANGTVHNCFTGLPYEILGAIVAFLPTPDVRTFGQASKGLKIIIPSELGQSFWAPRFSFEFDFVFEARKHQGNLDW